jgi:hypothetical protein
MDYKRWCYIALMITSPADKKNLICSFWYIYKYTVCILYKPDV